MSIDLTTVDAPARTVLNISQLNEKARCLLETSFASIWVEGEISNLVQAASGHWYFSLKDEKAQVRCAMFRRQNQLVNFELANGLQVMVKARASLYAGRGDFQLIVQYAEESGTGALQRAFELLKKQLAAEGLFSPERKKLLPGFPEKIGVISSPTGSVIHDICHVLKRRCPLTEITVLPAAVQGREAPDQIVNMLKLAEERFSFDALIIARGGGSLEDLQPFNEERVARAVAACQIPVVSSIGHETDFTITDFVADYRAPTPSAAAEVLSPDCTQWQSFLREKEDQFFRLINNALAMWHEKLLHLYKRLRHPEDRLREQSQRLDDLTVRLQQIISYSVAGKKQEIERLTYRLQEHSPEAAIGQLKVQTDHLKQQLQRAMDQAVTLKKQQLNSMNNQLHAYSPLNTLKRGYSIVQKNDHTVVLKKEDVSSGETVSIQLHEGQLACVIK